MSEERPSDLARVAKVSDQPRKLSQELHKPMIRIFKKE